MKIKSILKYCLLTTAILLPLTVSAAQRPFCERAFDHTRTSPRGVLMNECDQGLGFPTFNAYRNVEMFGAGETVLRDDEWDFAQVLKRYRNNTIADRDNELGLKNEISLSTGETANGFLYVHNGGNPERNFVNRDGSTPSNSTIAKDVRIRVDGFENIDGELISNQGTRHVFNAYISSSNTTPRVVQDNFVINVPNGKALKLSPYNSDGDPAGFIWYCPDGRIDDCDASGERFFMPQSLVDSDGIPLSSYFAGSGGRGGYFFASQGYRQFIFFKIEVVNAPVLECRNLTVQHANPGREYREGQEVRFNITDVTPESFLDNLRIETVEGRRANVRRSRDNRSFYVTNWDSTTVLDVRVADNRPCRTQIPFDNFVIEQCDFLELFPTEPISSLNVGETTTLGISVGPESPYRNRIAEPRHVGAGTSTLSRDKRFITVRDWDRSTIVTAYVPGEGSQCEDPQFFNDALTCENLSLRYDAEEYARVNETGRLTVTAEITPDGFDGTVVWDVQNADIASRSGNGKTITVENINENTEITAYVQGHRSRCIRNITFKDLEPRVCELLEISPKRYDYEDNGGRPRFEIDRLEPSSFEGPFTWTVENAEGETIQRQTSSARSFTPTFPLDGTQRVSVDVPNAKEETPNICSDFAISDRPPVGEICPGFEIKRAARTTFGYRTAYCPANGSPIKLLLDGHGDYDTEVVWRSNNADVIFTDGTQTRNAAIRTHVSNTVIVSGCEPGTTIRVHLSDPDEYEASPGICSDVIQTRDLPGDKPAEITKSVDRKYVSGTDIVTYTVRYLPLAGFFDGQFSTATLLDNIAGGIQGANPELNISGILTPIAGSQRINLPPAQYSGTIYSDEGLTIQGADLLARRNQEVVVTYQARVESALTEETCGVLENFCGEEFVNTVSDIYNLSASQKVTATCPFILSRGFGDVFLEDGFDGLIDVASCSNRTSSEGPVFVPDTPDEQEAPSTGSESINVAPHRICENSGTNNPLVPIPEQFKDVAKNFSSSICESAVLQTAEYIAGEAEQSLLRGIARIARGNTTLNNVGTLSNLREDQLDSYPGNPNPKNKVYRKADGQNLVIGSGGTTIEIDGSPKTIIVENANLIINSNLEYAPGSNNTVIAFVVIGGDIILGDEVSDTVGIFATIDRDGKGGSIKRFSSSSKLYTHTGSVFGDIQPLFKGQTVAGDLSRDRGTVTVRYDGRIVGNTPPGLEAVVEFNQFQTATGSTIYE